MAEPVKPADPGREEAPKGGAGTPPVPERPKYERPKTIDELPSSSFRIPRV